VSTKGVVSASFRAIETISRLKPLTVEVDQGNKCDRDTIHSSDEGSISIVFVIIRIRIQNIEFAQHFESARFVRRDWDLERLQNFGIVWAEHLRSERKWRPVKPPAKILFMLPLTSISGAEKSTALAVDD
jgi:hypothetical protein